MLSRSTFHAKNVFARSALPMLGSAPVRGMATEQQLKTRIKSVANIGKITKAMKMVSAAKLRRSQINLDAARLFAEDMSTFWPDPVVSDETKEGSKYLVVGCASDKGLCGAINSSVVRNIRAKLIDAKANKEEPQLVLYGDKARQGLVRLYEKHFVATFNDLAKLRDKSFDQAAELAQVILDQKFDRGELVYNWFRSMLSYETRTVPLFTFEQSMKNKGALQMFQVYGGRKEDVLKALYEFRLATRLFYFFAEGDTSELSARMNAMGNSSKNAEEMLSGLQLQYNRKRQAKITTELIEIISGAAAAEDMQG